jgi:hypothetical protein
LFESGKKHENALKSLFEYLIDHHNNEVSKSTNKMTASTPDKLIAGFPHSSLPKVTGEPTFEDLKVIRRLLNTNVMSVASYEGGGRHGHLGIIMTNEEYFAIAVDVFPVPNNPGPSAAVVAGMRAAVIAETTRLHKEATQVYRTYHNVN